MTHEMVEANDGVARLDKCACMHRSMQPNMRVGPARVHARVDPTGARAPKPSTLSCSIVDRRVLGGP